jgi:hypothetical protein
MSFCPETQLFLELEMKEYSVVGFKWDEQTLPVHLTNLAAAGEAVKEDDSSEIGNSGDQLSKGTLRIFGTLDVMALRAAIEYLVG